MSTSVQLSRYLFNVTDYHRMLETGVLNEDSQVELLNGEVIKMTPIAPRHAASVDRINDTLKTKLGKKAIVRVQNPVQLDDFSEPQPDISLLKRRADFYATGHPTSADVLVAIEVSDSSIDKDRIVKLPAYARAGIYEVWLVDLYEDRVEVHSNPYNGMYQEVLIVQRGQKILSKVFPQLRLKADDVLV
jgi:Uma2 family endonuclease